MYLHVFLKFKNCQSNTYIKPRITFQAFLPKKMFNKYIYRRKENQIEIFECL